MSSQGRSSRSRPQTTKVSPLSKNLPDDTIYNSKRVLVCPFEKYNFIEWIDCTSKCKELKTNEQISIFNDNKVLRINPARSGYRKEEAVTDYAYN